MRHSAETLLAEIDAAFAAREHPGDDYVAYIQRGWGTDCGGYQAQEWLRGKSRQDLVAEGMEFEHQDFVLYLRPKGWLYYFPAFATFALDPDHPAEVDDSLLTTIVLDPKQVAPFLTALERRAMVHFLEYLAERDCGGLAQLALDGYWVRFIGERKPGQVCSSQLPDNHQSPPAGARQTRRLTKALRREVASAFKRQHPGDDQLARTEQVFLAYEGNEARDWLRDKTWKQVLKEGVKDTTLIPFLELEGWLYFFPAFAILALDLDDPADLATTLIFRLWTSPEEISARLLPRERLAIVHWLEYLAGAFEQRGRVLNDAARALDDYWAYFFDEELYGDIHQEDDDALS